MTSRLGIANRKLEVGKRAIMWMQLIVAFTLFSVSACAQSTSSWIPIDAVDKNGKVTSHGINGPIINGSSYVTVNFKVARVHQKSNWFQALIENNRNVVVTVDLKGSLHGKSILDQRVIPSVDLGKKKSETVDVSWDKSIAIDLPAHFDALEFDVAISKAAKNGLSDLLNAATKLSESTPVLAMSPQTAAYMNGATAVSEFLFSNSLLQKKLRTARTITPGLSSGYYVIFAGDSPDAYSKYDLEKEKLKWSGGQVLFDGKILLPITYVVVEISTKNRRFADYQAALGTRSPWAVLYNQAINRSSSFTRKEDFNTLEEELTRILVNAQNIIGDDLSLTQAERDEIHNRVRAKATENANERRKSFAEAGSAPVANSVTGEGTKKGDFILKEP